MKSLKFITKVLHFGTSSSPFSQIAKQKGFDSDCSQNVQSEIISNGNVQKELRFRWTKANESVHLKLLLVIEIINYEN